VHDPALFVARDQSCVFENAQMLHEPRQRHAVGIGELRDRLGAAAQLLERRATGRVGQGGEDGVEPRRVILYHKV
jgi:hypothetical protein